MYSQIRFASIRESNTGRLMEFQTHSYINFIRSKEPEGFLLALAGLFGGLPENQLHNLREYLVTADILWEDQSSCVLHACLNQWENPVCVYSTDGMPAPLSVQLAKKVNALHKRRFRRGCDCSHIFPGKSRVPVSAPLGESDEILQGFSLFLQETHQRSKFGDTRPLFLYNFLERLDGAVDTGKILTALADTGRQVFIAVPHYYQINTREDIPYDAAIYTL